MISTFRRSITTCSSVYQSQRIFRGRRIQNRSQTIIPNRPQLDVNQPTVNPGVQHRLSAMEEDGVDTDIGPDMDLLEESESDFYNINSAHRQYEKEKRIHDELVSKRIVRQKYFQEQVPNFLTWSEKEHIRFLHANNPEDWTPETIAESFPTTPDGVKKLLKVVWIPASQSRIVRHDASALRNWKELKEGSLEGIKPDMKKHILKFSNRTIPPRQKKDIEETKQLSSKENNVGEFSSIITSYKQSIEDTTSESIKKIDASNTQLQFPEQNNQLQLENPNSSIIMKQELKSKNLTTLKELRSDISENAERNVEISPIDKLIMSSSNDINSITNSNNTIQNDSKTFIKEYNPNVPQKKTFDGREKKAIEKPYPERIRIPKNAFQKGVTYKVNDCFYDEDGRFLYRVPGMLANNSQSKTP